MQDRSNGYQFDQRNEDQFHRLCNEVIVAYFPDVRDGLKPVHRRILYGMNELGVTPDSLTRNQLVSQDVMGKYRR